MFEIKYIARRKPKLESMLLFKRLDSTASRTEYGYLGCIKCAGAASRWAIESGSRGEIIGFFFFFFNLISLTGSTSPLSHLYAGCNRGLDNIDSHVASCIDSSIYLSFATLFPKRRNARKAFNLSFLKKRIFMHLT